MHLQLWNVVKKHNLMQFCNNAFTFIKYFFSAVFTENFSWHLHQDWTLELLANCRSSTALHWMQHDFSNIVYRQGLYDFHHMSVVCEKLKKKVCKLTVRIWVFNLFYCNWTTPYWILSSVNHTAIKLFHRSNVIPYHHIQWGKGSKSECLWD